jgi:hypothetical protein
MNKTYYVSTENVEHACCWSAAILRRKRAGEYEYYGTSEILILECRRENAQEICDALNEQEG